MAKTPKSSRGAPEETPPPETPARGGAMAGVNEPPKVPGMEIVDFEPSVVMTDRKSLRELADKVIVITNIQIARSERYDSDFAIVRYFEPPEGPEVEAYTFSVVAIRMLEEMATKFIQFGKAVKVKVCVDRMKDYVYFEAPSKECRR